MATEEVQARHVFHAPTTGWDRIHAWRETTGEPVFVWGRHSKAVIGPFFRSVKHAFRQWVEKRPADLTLYHDGMGADALGPLDPAAHKVLFLHHWFPRWERHFDWNLRCTGKALVGHPALVQTLHERFAWIPERFIESIPQPLVETSLGDGTGTGPTRPRTGIWLFGQDWRRRGNRLRSIADQWPAEAGELEFIVDGRGQPGWARREGLIWNRDMPFEFALLRMHTWDATLLLNDYAFDAPWLQQALALDCFPLIPEGEGLARTPAWEAEAAPSPYPWGNFKEAVRLLGQWREEKRELLPDFRQWRDSLLAEHRSGPAFHAQWAAVKQGLLEQRPPRLRKRRPAPGWQLLSWYERIQRLRMGV